VGVNGKGTHMIEGSAIPKQSINWFRVPRGPANSVGANSLIYFGQKTVKAPAPTPMKNVPTQMTVKLSTIRRLTPIKRITFATSIILLFPYLTNNPPVKQLTIAPRHVIVVIIVAHLFFSEIVHSYLIAKTLATVLNEPRARPNWTNPRATLKQNEMI